MPTAFVTGASGFIGRRLLRSKPQSWTVRALTRTAPETTSEATSDASALSAEPQWVVGQLNDPATFASALPGADVVIHLAAHTGKGAPRQFEAVNRDATAALVEAAAEAGVRRFIFVSTIATQYPEHDRYPYGRTKKEAEAQLMASDLDWTIIRPTIVLGAGSPIFKSLGGLARLPMTPLFGNGQTKIQPVLADDVAQVLWAAAEDSTTVRQAIDVGGPDVLTFDAFMSKLRQRSGRGEGPLVHLPAGMMSSMLGLAEPAFRPLMPVTAGQLYAFRYDSTATPSPFMERFLPKMATIDAQLEASADG